MHASRQKPENHWRSVGAAVAKSGGSTADLERVLTGKKTVDTWIIEGFNKVKKPKSNPSFA